MRRGYFITMSISAGGYKNNSRGPYQGWGECRDDDEEEIRRRLTGAWAAATRSSLPMISE